MHTIRTMPYTCNEKIYSSIAIESKKILDLQESHEILEESQKILQGAREARSIIREILRSIPVIPHNGSEALPAAEETYAENILDSGEFTAMLSRASPLTPGHSLDFNKTYERLRSLLDDIKNELALVDNNEHDNKNTVPDINDASLDWAFQRYKRVLEKTIEKISLWKANQKENTEQKRNSDVEEKLKSFFDTSKMISKVMNASKGLHELHEKELPEDDKLQLSQDLNYEILIEKFLTDSETLCFLLSKEN